MSELDRASAWAGVASVGLTNAAIVGATVASPTFRWSGNALSDLGQPGSAVATPVTTLLFDGGLVLGGAVGLAFAAGLWRRTDSAVEGLGTVLLAVALLGMAGVGIFPAGRPLHVPAALTLYLGSMAAMAVYALGNALAGARRRAAGTLALVAAHVGVWWWWAGGGSVTRAGLAIPEFVGAALFSVWVVWTARRQLVGR